MPANCWSTESASRLLAIISGYGVHQFHRGRLLLHAAYDCAPVSLALAPNGLSAACSHGGWQVWLGHGLAQYVLGS